MTNGFKYVSKHGQIRFRTIRNLSAGIAYEHIDTMFFEHLQQLEFKHSRLITDVWDDFIRRHSRLSKLVITGQEVDGTLLQNILGFVPNLVEASFKVDLENAAEVLVQFLRTSPQLETLHLKYDSTTVPHPKMDELNRIRYFGNTES